MITSAFLTDPFSAMLCKKKVWPNSNSEGFDDVRIIWKLRNTTVAYLSLPAVLTRSLVMDLEIFSHNRTYLLNYCVTRYLTH